MQTDPRLNEIMDCLYRIAVKAVIIKDNKVLLVRDERDDGWTLPGGGVDIGERLEDAVFRELQEEIGVSASDIESDFKIQSVTLGHIKDGVPRCNVHFSIKLNNTDIGSSSEIEAMEWIPISDLETQDFDSSAGSKNELISLINKLHSK